MRLTCFALAVLVLAAAPTHAQQAESTPATCDAAVDPRIAALTSRGDTVRARALIGQWEDLPGRPVFVDSESAGLRMLNDRAVGRLMGRRYPPSLREAGRGGAVSLAIRMDARGHAVDAVVLRGTGEARLDSASVEVARTMRFTPVVHDGCAVPAIAVLPIVWSTAPQRPAAP